MHYEYKCRECGHQFVAEQRITDEPLTKCESCGKAALERMISGGAGVITSGGGKASMPQGDACGQCCGMNGGACPYSE
ncbi:zinc ribbon domain-containing protein [Candidatus Sumerlaeota bacterium]|nr:zinc ribbon domain-containing protein [Candidatus Sumerlaeota bacterium]